MKTETTKLQKIPYGNAKVITEYDEYNRIARRTLRSYETDVVKLEFEYTDTGVYNRLKVSCPENLFSMTTKKHISAFMQQFTEKTFKEAKEAYLTGKVQIWKV